VRCLNEATENSAQGVFRAWDKRLDAPENPLESNEDDPELLLHVPFEGAAKVKALCVIGEAGGYSPSELRVFTNRDDLDFGTANDLPPVQRWDLAENLRGDIELPCNVSHSHPCIRCRPGLGWPTTCALFLAPTVSRQTPCTVSELLPCQHPGGQVQRRAQPRPALPVQPWCRDITHHLHRYQGS
jgi:PITH domain